jgi:hypothetical protein
MIPNNNCSRITATSGFALIDNVAAQGTADSRPEQFI